MMLCEKSSGFLLLVLKVFRRLFQRKSKVLSKAQQEQSLYILIILSGHLYTARVDKLKKRIFQLPPFYPPFYLQPPVPF